MEKIYMNESEPKKSKISFSVVLTFAVAIFAVASLAVVGFNHISYAAPTPYSGSRFEFHVAKNGTDILGLNAKAGSDVFYVPVYLADSTDFNTGTGIPLFCVEHFADIHDGATYNKSSDPLNDNGLVYILNKSGVLGGSGIVTAGTSLEDKYKETYATQVAIWLYYYESYYLQDSATYVKHSLANYSAGHDDATQASKNYSIIQNANVLSPTASGTTDIDITDLYTSKIKPVVDAAKSPDKNYVKDVSINGDLSISKVGDDDYYQTSELSVSCSPNDLVNYTVSVSGINGAFVVDKSGTEKTTFTTSETFFVRVPVNKVTTSVADVDVHVTALVNNFVSGSYFTSGSYQKVVLVTANQGNIDADRKIRIVGTPDTGMNKAQTIYFIGLIVLLCGVGIIYANTKQESAE